MKAEYRSKVTTDYLHCTVSVLCREEGYTRKISLSPRAIFHSISQLYTSQYIPANYILHSISQLESQYIHSHLANDEPAAAVVYAAVSLVAM